MLVEIAIGDAYGAGFEFTDRERIEKYNNLQGYVAHPLGVKAGRYTDDTQMSMAITETLLEHENPSLNQFAEFFVQVFRRDPRLGYAKGFQGLLDSCEGGEDLISRIAPNSRRNGAAMRSVPLGIIRNTDDLLSLAESQASITHNTVEGIVSSKAIALMSHLLIYEKTPVSCLSKEVSRRLDIHIDENWDGEVSCDALETLYAVNTVLKRNRSFSELLVDAVSLGGDTDSVAAIAAGLASLTSEYVNEIPDRLISSLENGKFGLEYLMMLDCRIEGYLDQLR